MSVQRPVFLMVLFSFGVFFIFALTYRFEHPSLEVHVQEEKTDKMEFMQILSLMQQLQKNPNDKEILKSLGMLFMEMNAWERSLSFWNRLVKVDPKNKMALSQSGYCYFELKDYQQAVSRYKQVLAVDPNDPIALFNLGLLYARFLPDPKMARFYLQKVINSKQAEPKVKKEAQKLLSLLKE